MTPHPFSSSSRDTSPEGAGWALVIDDHPLFCDALEMTLRSVADYRQVETANCLAAALTLLEQKGHPALILLDLNLPDVNGLDGLIRLKRAVSGVPVIIVSSMTDNTVINGAITAGASGFVPKHSRRNVFKDAIEQIGRGEVYKPCGYVESANAQEEDSTLGRLASLTNQQSRILQLICEGKLNKQIAYDLSIAETTVKAHVTAIMRKLGVQSRTQAVLAAHDARFSHVLPKEDPAR
ncbi:MULTISPECIES: response regulator [unclassified Sulfitobacter]|jgi:DNA-binding NarL/FixJ family response regulator|uniref:response regulator n=1 Tax=unclassified Sulfitobacter TaxID=196795 RepID=UPI0007C40708|nr:MULTISPECIES: response regulator transcription factor [unclassified Sulfitobacter]KZY02672.1 DNA-binding response regulator [Sulfitobacter sp. HI0023]KZY24262.1 DNA-binding response regulator [Sulfitobacter sp. HI0040]KZZ70278.1 DNA-binding response regulator [Sulfitobacter sp. HI0129]